MFPNSMHKIRHGLWTTWMSEDFERRPDRAFAACVLLSLWRACGDVPGFPTSVERARRARLR
ncbi:hypothetical protein QFZ75_003921 [Streptomyces sp. V3I8]|nr:hypothetical protein [Streptomyces sp. V3I8]